MNANCMDVFNSIVEEYSNVIVVSDPPFNIGYHYNKYEDSMKDEEYFEMLVSLFGKTPSVVIHYPESLYKLSFSMGKCPERVVSWVYNSNTARQHRDVAFFGVKPDFNAVRQPYKNLLALCTNSLKNSIFRNMKIIGIHFNADKLSAKFSASNACCTASHKRIYDNCIMGKNSNNVLHNF